MISEKSFGISASFSSRCLLQGLNCKAALAFETDEDVILLNMQLCICREVSIFIHIFVNLLVWGVPDSIVIY